MENIKPKPEGTKEKIKLGEVKFKYFGTGNKYKSVRDTPPDYKYLQSGKPCKYIKK